LGSGCRSMFHDATTTSDYANLDLSRIGALETRAADCCRALFLKYILDSVTTNATLPGGTA